MTGSSFFVFLLHKNPLDRFRTPENLLPWKEVVSFTVGWLHAAAAAAVNKQLLGRNTGKIVDEGRNCFLNFMKTKHCCYFCQCVVLLVGGWAGGRVGATRFASHVEQSVCTEARTRGSRADRATWHRSLLIVCAACMHAFGSIVIPGTLQATDRTVPSLRPRIYARHYLDQALFLWGLYTGAMNVWCVWGWRWWEK